MKARVNVYQPQGDAEGQIQIPNALKNMRQYYLSHATSVMRLFGVAHVTVKPVTAGLRSVPQINFRPLDPAPDGVQADSRNDVVRRLAEEMLMVGVLEVEITPDEGELRMLSDSWEKLDTDQGAPELFSGTGRTGEPGAVQLNIEKDPTASVVISDDPTPTVETDETNDSETEGSTDA
jgi:hypothetical protein